MIITFASWTKDTRTCTSAPAATVGRDNMDEEKTCPMCKTGKMTVNNGIASCTSCDWQELVNTGKMIVNDE